MPGAGIEPARLAAGDFECKYTTKTVVNKRFQDRGPICVTFCVTLNAMDLAVLRDSEYISSKIVSHTLTEQAGD